jgi:hypothetical protein
MGISKKILEIMSEVDVVDGDIHIKGGKTNYKASSETALISALRPYFISKGLIFYPNKLNHFQIETIKTKYGDNEGVKFLTSAAISYIVEDVESGETREIVGIGSGEDGSDKGSGKAFTYAGKYALKKLFMLLMDRDEDPDASGSDRNIESRRPAPPKPDLESQKPSVDTERLYSEIVALYESKDPASIIRALKETLDFGIMLSKISTTDREAYLAKLSEYEKMPVGSEEKKKKILAMVAILQASLAKWAGK